MSKVLQFTGGRVERMRESKPALEDGYTRIVNPLLDQLCWFPLSSLEFRMVNTLMRMTYGYNKGKDRIADSQLGSAMKISRTKVNAVKNELLRRRILLREGAGYGQIKINTNVEEWEQKTKATKPPKSPGKFTKKGTSSNLGTVSPITIQDLSPITVHTKDKRQYKHPTDVMSEQSCGREKNKTTGSETKKPKPPAVKKPNAVIQSANGRAWGEQVDLEIAEFMAQHIDSRLGADADRNRNMITWANEVRLIRERDERPPQAIKALFAWSQSHHFWHKNILSPGKLRKQWSRLAIEHNEERKAREAGHETGRADRKSGGDELTRQLTDLEYARNNF